MRILEAENDIAGGTNVGTAGPIDLDSGLKSVVVKYRLDFDNSQYVKKVHQNNLIFPNYTLHVVCTFTKSCKLPPVDSETNPHSSSSFEQWTSARDN